MDRKKIHVDSEIKGLDLAKKLELDSCIGFKSDDKVFDLHADLPFSSEVVPLYKEDDEYIHFLRHDAAHVLAQALTVMYPEIRFGKQFFRDKNVFGFDVYLPDHEFTKNDFKNIEENMRKVVDQKDDLIRHIWSKEKALQEFSEDKFKCEIVENSGKDSIMLYEHGDYIDICGGPRGINNDHVGYDFTLLEIENVDWLYDSEKKMQRIIGACFRNKDEMNQFLMEYK